MLILEIIFFIIYFLIFSLTMIYLTLNQRRLKYNYKIDSLFLYIIAYLLNFAICSNILDCLPQYSLQITLTTLMMFIFYNFNKVKLIGLTGGISCGKSTVSKIFKE